MKACKCFAVVLMLCFVLTGLGTSVFASPKEITECRSIERPGSYILGNNLTVSDDSPSRDCLEIETNSVSIDLAGFRIKGRGKGRAIRTDDSPRRDITVRNGTITDFETGIAMGFTGTSVTVESVHFIDNRGLAVDILSMGFVKNCMLSRNGLGIRVGSRSRVIGNTSNSNIETGIRVGAGSIVEGNVADGNGQHGFVVGGGSSISNNTGLGNNGVGMLVTCPSNLIGNTMTQNGDNYSFQGTGCHSADNISP